MKYIITIFVFIIMLWSSNNLSSQVSIAQQPAIEISDFMAMHQFLASDWMEGRETGEKGSLLAADYIASMMDVYGLKPYGDKKDRSVFDPYGRSYFQNFEVLKYKTQSASLSIISHSDNSRLVHHFIRGIDYELLNSCKSEEGESKIVFAAYGISAPEYGYDDYKKINVQGRIVIIMDGFPGHRNVNSPAYQKFAQNIGITYSEVESKIKTAMEHGAVAVILVNSFHPYLHSSIHSEYENASLRPHKFMDPDYEDDHYTIIGEKENIPLYRMSKEATGLVLKGSEIDLKKVEDKAAYHFVSSVKEIDIQSMSFSVKVQVQTLVVRNVIGMIPGQDSTKNIIIGAHYDHLGIRNGQIYNGSDDNASGTAGMLALGEYWKNTSKIPPCNLIFAAWTAEEKGHWGSIYFANKFECTPQNTLLNINFDMISRSAPKDSTGLIISVGTRKESENLRVFTMQNNSQLQKPFCLDLWDTSTGGGSDYATFHRRGIPVLTFFSGYNKDYHSIRDVSFYADYKKMAALLNLSNDCLKDFMKTLHPKADD